MPQDFGLEPRNPLPGRGASLLYLASVLALAGLLAASFCTSYGLLQDHPGHAREVLPQLSLSLALGLLVLAGQGALVFLALVRPYRAAALRVENLAHALDKNSHRDALTGVLNRTAFDQLIVRELDALRRYGVSVCGLMLDVDGFRMLNERLGYEAGDQVLRELAQLLQSHMRKADFLFRWRSGRFLILALGADEEQAVRLGGRLADMVAGHPFRQEARVTVCVGVAQATSEDTPETFAARVKTALTQAKEKGPGGVGGSPAAG